MNDEPGGTGPQADDSFSRAVGRLGPALLATLDGLERVQRRLHPPQIESLKQLLAPLSERLADALEAFAAEAPPVGMEKFAAQLCVAGEDASRALALFCDPAAPQEAVPRMLQSMREHCRAQEALYPLRRALPPANRFFLEESLRFGDAGARDLEQFDPTLPDGVSVGIHSAKGDANGRGGFSLYVPERFDATQPWPLVVALHGGFGQGRDFVWTWLRAARARGWLLLAPTSLGTTWSLQWAGCRRGRARSDARLRGRALERGPGSPVADGLVGRRDLHAAPRTAPDSAFTHLAPGCGVLHPQNFVNGNLERAAGRRIRLVHGTLDWMFPVALAREASADPRAAGAEIVYDEIGDLSHAWPGEINVPNPRMGRGDAEPDERRARTAAGTRPCASRARGRHLRAFPGRRFDRRPGRPRGRDRSPSPRS